MPTTQPIFPGRQTGLETARDRWRRRAAISLQNGVAMDVVRQAYLYDLDRINKGGTPMSDREAAIAISSEKVMPGETGMGRGRFNPLGFAENAARDLKDIVLGLPQLPGFMLKEPGAIMDPDKGLIPSVSEGVGMLAEGDFKGLGRIAGAPGVRLVPGSFTAEMIGGGYEGDKSVKELAAHPVFTFLDLLPIASKAGLTAKAVKKIRESGPYDRVARSMSNTGSGGAHAQGAARRGRQTQRAAEEGLLVEDFLGGRFATVDELKTHLGTWLDDFTDAELSQTFDTMQFGEWNPGMPAPEWARNSGRGNQWLAMANDTVEMIKWFSDHGHKTTGELLMIGGELYPSTAEIKSIIKKMEKAEKGDPTVVRQKESATTKEVSHGARAAKKAQELKDQKKVVDAHDPLAASATVTSLFERIEKMRLPDLGFPDEIKAATAKSEADAAARDSLKPREETVISETGWPEDVAPMRDGERAYHYDKERSPVVDGDEVAVTGRTPTTEAGRLVATRRRIDGELVAENAADLTAARVAAERNLETVANEVGMNPDQARAAVIESKGNLRPGSLEDYVKEMNDVLGDAATDLAAEIEIPIEGQTGTRTVTFLEKKLEELRTEGWTERTIKGEKYFVEPTEVSRLKAALKAARKQRDQAKKDSGAKKGELLVNTEASATPVQRAIEDFIRIDLRDELAGKDNRNISKSGSKDVAASDAPEGYRIEGPADAVRKGMTYPTSLTAYEKNLIQSGRGSRMLVDPEDGAVWVADEFRPKGYEGAKADTYVLSRQTKNGSWQDKLVSADDIDNFAVMDDWADVDMKRFEGFRRESFTEERLDQLIEELVEASRTAPEESFVSRRGSHSSVAAQRVMDRAKEILPDRPASAVGQGELWRPIVDMTEGRYGRYGPTIVDEGTRLADRQALVEKVEADIARAEATAAATVKPASRVVDAHESLLQVRKMEQDLQARLEAGTATFTEKPAAKGKAHPDEPELRRLYDQLDEIDATGSTHPLYAAKESLEIRAKELFDAGVRVKPSQRKMMAALGKSSRKVKKGDQPGYDKAKGRAKASADQVKDLNKVQTQIVGGFKTLQTEVVTLLRNAEADFRGNRWTEGREKLVKAEKALNRKASQNIKSRLKDHAPGLLDELTEIETAVNQLRTSTTTTGLVNKARAKQSRIADELNDARIKAEAAKARGSSLDEKITESMSEAEKAVLKWQGKISSLSARWHPLYRRELERRIATSMKRPTPEAMEALMFESYTRAAKLSGLSPKEIGVIRREAWQAVKDMEAAGVNPIYIPHRQLGNRGRAPGKMVGHRLGTPAMFKTRHLNNAEPYIRNPAIAISETAMDFMREAGTEAFFFGRTLRRGGEEIGRLDGIFSAFGRSFDDLIDQYRDEIAAEMARRPHESPGLVAKRIVERDYTTIDPTKWGMSDRWAPEFKVKYRRKSIGATDEVIDLAIADTYFPKSVNTTIEAQTKVGGLVPYRGAYDKVMDVFRVSALALSPRFLVYNAVGGMVMLMARTDPTVLQYVGRAKKMVDEGKMDIGISKGAAMVDPDLIKQFEHDFRRLSTEKQTGFLWGIREGQWLGGVIKAIQKGANKSFQMNEYFDSVYRSMAYLHESDRLIKKGRSATDAAEAGVQLANKILQDWDAMLPWERVAMRRIFPFYGWMKHVLKYTFTLPFDHPLRVSVMTNFAAAEMEDFRSGIPQWMSHTFFIGKEGPDTKQWSINARAANPFSDLARLADFDSREYGSGVLLGFFTQTSPLIGAVGETLGINPMSGRPSLYPEMVYSPDTGRLRAVAPSILQTFPRSIIPQIEGFKGLAELAGVSSMSSELRQLRQRDPDAFASRIWGSFGTPFAPRRRSRGFEMIKSGLAQDQATGDIVNRALRTGDWSNALQYERAHIRGQTYNVRDLYGLAKNNPELLEVVLSAASR